MTSHYRHRRSADPAASFTGPMEVGEIAVNTANRQIAAGAPGGTPIALIAVRYFDVNSKYAINDFVVNGSNLYVALEAVNPGPFNAAQWRISSHDPSDPTDLSNYLLKTGDAMTGPLVLAGDPAADLEAATKAYVDNATPPPPNALNIPSDPVGELQATNVQNAIAELEAEKVAKAGDTMTGQLLLPTPLPGTDPEALFTAVRRDYLDVRFNQGLATKLNRTGPDTFTGNLDVLGDIRAARGPQTGLVFFGQSGVKYLYFDGATYHFTGGALNVGGLTTTVGATINGQLTQNGNSYFYQGATHTINTNSYFGGAPTNFQIVGSSAYPTICFHSPGYWIANFGMHVDGNFYMGGGSFGEGYYYKFLTTRDGTYSAGQRTVHVTDYWYFTNYGFTEPGGPHCHFTGMTGNTTPDGWNYGNMVRHRAIQEFQNGAWNTTGAAS